jgi:hypothetical chaperone protein
LAQSFVPLVYAIDFGTSNSLLAAANMQGTVPPIALDPHASDPTVLRSILLYPEKGACLIGAEALDAYVEQGMQGRLLRSMKRFLPMPSFIGTELSGRRHTLEEIIAAVLHRMRTRANLHFKTDVRRVLLGRPARFAVDDAHDALAETRLRKAATLAGFEHVDFCPEPVAAARDFSTELDTPKAVLIVDLGGGTSDFSVVRMGRGGFAPEDVLAIGGVSVAGDAFDGALMRRHVSRHFGSEVSYRAPFGSNVLTMPTPLMELLCSPATLALLQQRDVKNFLKEVRAGALTEQDKQAVERLLCLAEDGLGFSVFEAIEVTKRALSEQLTAEFFYGYSDFELRESISRAAFEHASAKAVSAILQAMDETLRRAELAPSDIDLVCLTGGTSKVPAIGSALDQRFGSAKLHHLRGFHSVVEGLAHHAHQRLNSATLR